MLSLHIKIENPAAGAGFPYSYFLTEFRLAFNDGGRFGGIGDFGRFWHGHVHAAAHDAATSYCHAATASFEADPGPAVVAPDGAASVILTPVEGRAEEVIDFTAPGNGFEIVFCIFRKMHGYRTTGGLGDDGCEG